MPDASRWLPALETRDPKPRRRGLTEIRGPYYTPFGPRMLADVLDTVGDHIDILKFGGGSFLLMPEESVREMINLAHSHEVLVSTGGFLERIMILGSREVDAAIGHCRDLGFDIVEISSGFLSVDPESLIAMADSVRAAGMTAKPEINVQFGAGGGATSTEELEAEGLSDVGSAISLARRHLEAGAELIMVESEGITENVTTWRTDVISALVDAIGLDHLVFEAADPKVFGWYVKQYGPSVNLFCDHSQVLQLSALRSGMWAEASLWGRVTSYERRPRQGG